MTKIAHGASMTRVSRHRDLDVLALLLLPDSTLSAFIGTFQRPKKQPAAPRHLYQENERIWDPGRGSVNQMRSPPPSKRSVNADALQSGGLSVHLVILTYGGWRDHFTAVLEPCTNMPKDLETARRAGACAHLEPGEPLECTVRVDLA